MHNIAPNTDKRADLVTIYGAPEGQDARILARRAREIMPQDRVLIHIALDDARLSALRDLLNFFAPDVKVITLPAWDCLPYDRVSPHGDVVAARVAALTQMMVWDQEKERYPRIILTSVNAALQRVMPRETLQNASFSAVVGGRIDLDQMTMFLAQNGYLRTDTVRETGDFAVRGGIVDIFPAGYDDPIRLDLFGDEVESIKTFDPLSQRTDAVLKSFALQPVTEFFLNDDSVAQFRRKYRDAFGVVQKDDPLYGAVSEGRRYNGMEHWLPLFYERMDSVFDYVPQAAVMFDHHARDSYTERMVQIRDFYDARQSLERAAMEREKKQGKGVLSGSIYHPLPVETLYIEKEEWQSLTAAGYDLSPFGAADGVDAPDEGARKGRDFVDIRALPDGDVFAELKKYIMVLHTAKKQVVIATYSEGSKTRLRGVMENASIKDVVEIKDARDLKKLKPHEVGLCVLALEHGFAAPDLVVLSEQDILGDRLARKAKKSRKSDNFLTEVSALDEGDLVVHIDHGIGRFLALETVNAAGTYYDCLKIEYAGGDRLYVPVVNLDVLSRFGSDEGTTQLDKLGGAGWQARKAKAKKNLMEIADKLLGIAAARQLRKSDQLQVSPELYNEFAARFPYSETEDQERSINSVLVRIRWITLYAVMSVLVRQRWLYARPMLRPCRGSRLRWLCQQHYWRANITIIFKNVLRVWAFALINSHAWSRQRMLRAPKKIWPMVQCKLLLVRMRSLQKISGFKIWVY